jgi:hypothetical protein
MPKLEMVQTALSSGELTPRVHGRLDIERYGTGAAEITNFIVQKHGGVMKRPGSRFVAETKDSADFSRLLPFQYSNDQSYALEFGDQYIRFFTNQAPITVPTVTAAITNGTFVAGITSWTDNSAGTGVISHDAVNERLTLNSGGTGATNQAAAEQGVTITETTTDHYLRFEIVSPLPTLGVIMQIGSATTLSDIAAPVRFFPGYHIVKFDPNSNASAFIQFINDADAEFDLQVDNVNIIAGGALELQAPYLNVDVNFLHYTQSADVLFVGSDIFRPYELQRFANDEWSLVEHAFQNGPWLPVNSDASTQMQVSAVTGNAVTLTATSVDRINGGSGFLSSDIGRLIGIQVLADWGWGIITGVTSTTVVTVATLNDFDGTPATDTTSWMMGAWSDTTGWPLIPTFHSGRFAWAFTTDNPNTFWLSRSDNFNDHRPFDDDDVVVDSHALSGNTATDQVNAIRWIVSAAPGLLIGTSRAEFVFRPASTASSLSPSNREVVLQTNRGSAADVNPSKVGHLVLFIQRGGKVLRQATFNFDVDGVTAQNISILSEHLLKKGITETAYQQNDDSLLWMLRSDGKLICITHEQDQDMRSFHQHGLGGAGIVESIISIPVGPIDQVWAVVRRTINGATKRYVEYLSTPFDEDLEDTVEEAVYVDSSLRLVPSGTSVTGLGHLEGEVVSVLLDGAVHPDKTVTGGAITLDRTGLVAQVGLKYTARLKTLPIDVGVSQQTTRGNIRRIYKAFLQILASVGGFAGTTSPSAAVDDALQELQFREPAIPMGQAIPPFTGIKRVPLPGRHEQEKQVIVEHSQPLPFTLLSVVMEMDVGGS